VENELIAPAAFTAADDQSLVECRYMQVAVLAEVDSLVSVEPSFPAAFYKQHRHTGCWPSCSGRKP
jgi:hypothetical protein